MELLKRVLYVQAALWALAGVALVVVPRLVTHNVFSQIVYPDYAWVRIVGAQLLGGALISVLIGQSVEDRWWWAWAFVIMNLGIATIAAAKVVFGGPTGSSLMYWLIAGVEVVITGAMLWGMAKAGTEQPPDLRPPED